MKNKVYYNWQKIKASVNSYVANNEDEVQFQSLTLVVLWVHIQVWSWWLFKHKKKMFVFSQDRTLEDIMLEAHNKYLYDVFPVSRPFDIEEIRKAWIELKSLWFDKKKNKEQRIWKMIIWIDPAMPKELQDQIKKDLWVDEDNCFKWVTLKEASEKIHNAFAKMFHQKKDERSDMIKAIASVFSKPLDELTFEDVINKLSVAQMVTEIATREISDERKNGIFFRYQPIALIKILYKKFITEWRLWPIWDQWPDWVRID